MGAILSRRKVKKRSQQQAQHPRSDDETFASAPRPVSRDSLSVAPQDEGRLSVDPLPPRRASETDAQSDHERSGEDEEGGQRLSSAPASKRPIKRRSRKRKKKGKPTRLLSSQRHTPTPTSGIEWKKGGMIGSGGVGKVYLGLDTRTGELMAVKEVELLGTTRSLQTLVNNLLTEISLMKELHHENIVRYIGGERVGNRLNIFMEYVPGGSLASVIKNFGGLRESVVRAYTRQILEGLSYLHQNRIVHRDIKGQNLLLSTDGTVKLSDFGASKRIQDIVSMDGYQSLKGTPYWMAPEIIRQEKCTSAVDIWSVGCTVIEMMTEKPPWSTKFSSPVAAMFHIADKEELPPFPTDISEEGISFLRLCFQRNPNDRPSARELTYHPFVEGHYFRPNGRKSIKRREEEEEDDEEEEEEDDENGWKDHEYEDGEEEEDDDDDDDDDEIRGSEMEGEIRSCGARKKKSIKPRLGDTKTPQLVVVEPNSESLGAPTSGSRDGKDVDTREKKKKKKKKEKEKEKEKDYHHDSIEMEDERMSREFASRPTDEEDSERHSIIQYLTVKSVRDAQRLMDDSLSEEWKCLTERHGSRTRRRDIRSVFGGEDTSSAKE
eukprot:TRINITY_DN1347_c0_g1_i4.p1 TRINITY_DN1347_c0_g1~~TRINITY_DN1347_c0_g1_i4.p1  ORF type:complete len:605 (+),score=198.32 TRINITY_DN1347_c0_g1_i4:101-1915(+)